MNKLKIECMECNSKYAIILCIGCGGHCGIKDFMSGSTYECSCGKKMKYVICNGCNNVLGLPPGRDY